MIVDGQILIDRKVYTLNKKLSMIKDFLGKEWFVECIGCAIAEHRMIPPGNLIYEDEVFTIQQDPLVPINGFFIVNVKRHINSITQLNELERNQLMELINNCISCMKKLDIASEVSIIQEESSSHLHFWILPHRKWMIEKLNSSNYRTVCKYAQENKPDDISEILETISKMTEMLVI